ncbi:phage replisome organizer N-terminal domain-containing protein [Lysinibacillus antri]|uniref:DnaD domain protein n=1 Tax=Lysinibacillus antri TaxID=2498145 RepID=A0A3S0PA51_9BACI|nr:phage replisome organizer N-terminal domain-containing protein [Lysinibacillus antri]RUL56488.1 hypothetical protein EK386_02325 [Lysinibacillus antri]
MASISWIKLKTDMFDDEKIKLIERMPEGDTILIVWIKLLTYAGKANCNGYIMIAEDIPMNIEEMAIIFNRPLEKVRYAIQVLQRYRMLEIDENEQFYISNWEKHQNIDGMERVRKLNAERNKKYRERKKQGALQAPAEEPQKHDDVSVTSRDETDLDKDLDLDIDIDKEKETDIDKDKKDIKKNVCLSSSQSPSIDMNFLLIQDTFRNLIREPKPQDLSKMDEALEFYETSLILEAIKAAKGKGKTFSYALGILDNWRTEDDIKTYDDWKVKKGARSQNGKQSVRQNHEETSSSLDEFYRQLERDKQAWGG